MILWAKFGAIGALVGAAAGGYAGWQWRDGEAAKRERELAEAVTKAEQKAREVETTWANNARKAADVYAQSMAKARSDAAGSRDALGELQRAVARADRAASAAGATVRVDDASNARTVVGQCASALQQVAEAADACEGRLRGLQEWVRATR